jgi:hypothetical protein
MGGAGGNGASRASSSSGGGRVSASNLRHSASFSNLQVSEPTAQNSTLSFDFSFPSVSVVSGCRPSTHPAASRWL